MARPVFVGASAAAMLPAALAAALLVSAPFAGTTTTPLAESTPKAVQHHASSAAHHPDSAGLSTGDMLALGAAEAGFLALGMGVFVGARRRHASS